MQHISLLKFKLLSHSISRHWSRATFAATAKHNTIFWIDSKFFSPFFCYFILVCKIMCVFHQINYFHEAKKTIKACVSLQTSQILRQQFSGLKIVLIGRFHSYVMHIFLVYLGNDFYIVCYKQKIFLFWSNNFQWNLFTLVKHEQKNCNWRENLHGFDMPFSINCLSFTYRISFLPESYKFFCRRRQ